jgi:uncharacterized protein (TIGR02118 family)
MTHAVLELAVASNDVDAARGLAERLGGTLYSDERDVPGLPFRALSTVVTDDLESVSALADAGLYLVCRRVVKPGTAGVLGLFPLLRHPDLTHREADAHWRDVHAPLALKHHAYMTHYAQLSVVHTLSGAPLDGFALCGFESLEDLRERFFSGPDSRAVINEDVAKFADMKRSPRRLIVSERRYGP